VHPVGRHHPAGLRHQPLAAEPTAGQTTTRDILTVNQYRG
jgi:hypothetical protein